MSETQYVCESRFHIYPKDVPLFVEYCSRFQYLQHLKLELAVDREQDPDHDSYFTYRASFIATVGFHSERDSLIFGNVFVLFFTSGRRLP